MSSDRIVRLNADLLLALAPGAEIDGAFDSANMMLIPLQIKEGGTTLVDYSFNGQPSETGALVGQYDYDDGLPEPVDLALPRQALAAAVAAKLRYWDALRQIEGMHSTHEDGDVSDRAAEHLEELVSTIASTLDDADQAEAIVDDEYAARMTKIFKDFPL